MTNEHQEGKTPRTDALIKRLPLSACPEATLLEKLKNLETELADFKDLASQYEGGATGIAMTIHGLIEQLAEANKTIDAITKDPNYEGGVYYWINKHDKMMTSLGDLLVKYQTLQSSLDEWKAIAGELFGALTLVGEERQFPTPCYCDTISRTYCVGQMKCKSANHALTRYNDKIKQKEGK